MDMILKNTFQSISPAYELIGDVTVGTNTTQVDFTGLNIGKDDELLLVSECVNPTGNNSVNHLTVNGVGTPSGGGIITQYYAQENAANGTSVAGNRTNNAYAFFTWPSSRTISVIRIRLTNSGYFTFQSSNTLYVGGTTPWVQNICVASTFTVSSMTSLKVIANTTNSIGTGSRFQLYKLVAEKVADIIVPSNTTSVDITGLNIGKDGEYYLVSDVVNPTTTNSNYAIIFNENHVESNYWYQQLYAASNGVSATRANQFISIYCAANNNKTLCSTNIKLTNSGYGIQQNSNVSLYGGSLVEIIKRYVTTTFTASTISHIRIASYVVNGVGANSRFTLYKMK